MDVVKSNFPAVLEKLDEELQQSSFLAIDAEFSGLKDGEIKLSALDTPADRYEKILSSSMQFLILQFGLSIFRFESNIKKYVNKTYNFYIFPNTSSTLGLHDCKFLSQASSLGFLASQGFDFNKLIREGIPYLNQYEEEKLTTHFLKKKNYLIQTIRLPQDISDKNQNIISDTVSKVAAFLTDKENKFQSKLTIECSATQCRLLVPQLETRFSGATVTSTEKVSHFEVLVQKQGPLSAEASDKHDLFPEKNEIHENVGFSHVIRKISNSKKLVIGHNMMLDLCHILNQFCEPLPKEYEDFKDMINTIFPKFIDTKVMANTKPLKDLLPNSALEPLLKSLLDFPFKKVDIVQSLDFPSYSVDDKKSHEAGYDAFITGICFIAMGSYLEEIALNVIKECPHQSPLLTPFFQKIFMMRVLDIPYMNVSGPDLEPSREHVFYITFPTAWKIQDIFHLFKNYGPIGVDWIDGTSAFVTLHRKDYSYLVLKETVIPIGCTILSYASYKQSINFQVYVNKQNKTPNKRPSAETPYAKTSSKKVCKIPSSANCQKLNEPQFQVSNDWE